MKNRVNTYTRSIGLSKYNNIENFVSTLQDTGYVFIHSNSFHKLQGENQYTVSNEDKLQFIASWKNLELDRFISDNGLYRTRRHATSFELDDFLDIAMVNDHIVHHGVSEIQPQDNSDNKVGLRDVLVITFKEMNK